MTLKEAQKQIDKRNNNAKEMKRWSRLDFFIWCLSLVAAALLIRAVIFTPVRVKGTSMLSTLKEGDYMFVDRLSYAFGEMKRGDIVICYYPQNNEYSCVKRIIGLPGETVKIENGQVYINNVPLEEDYLTEKISSNHDGVWYVEKGTVFVLGDNRRVSRDSTSVGCVPKERIIGRVRCRLYPFNKISIFGNIEYTV